MKDNFSTQSSQYAKFRPTYPKELYTFILNNVSATSLAWDCATGNGQVAIELAKSFDQVYASDISTKQLANAPKRPNIVYSVEPAEQTSFSSASFDLITVAQAIHWFKFDDFFKEVKRVLRPNGLFLAVGYGLMELNAEIDSVILRLYNDILGSYWDEERKHIENEYESIQFPFSLIETPKLAITTTWNFEQLIGYLETWSSLQHYLKANNENPIDLIVDDLKKAWGKEETKTVNFPLIIKAGR
jgi:ubiquinone/menaquinone biosynthesis C-methylase UbiE